MPLYEYRCDACGARFEQLRSPSHADDATPCRECGASQSRRLLSRFAAVSRGEDGSRRVGGGCSSCAGGSCATCGVH